ncbi:ABC transporter permease [Mucilaginibacter sp. HMF5004]|uniref:ABC transporter permease n=1 Tax=Mucilaginibacter rivuli TaxID=2857527 RepID=UPI001C5F65DD|nr:ABC transporter permease [Mucilaginibacter rivuli]MBW4889718.1 ABC transporter permease [Mucilaginibacter rivuli]
MIFLKLFAESFVFAMDALRQNKLRTTLSLLGITIGIFSIIAVFSAVDTLSDNLNKSVSKLGSNTIFIQKMPWIFEDDFPWWKYNQRPALKIRDMEELENRMQTAQGIYYQSWLANRTIKYESKSVDNVTITAVSINYNKTRPLEFQEGRYFTDNESRGGAPVAMIGHAVAEGLFLDASLAEGKMIKIFGRNVRVVGVYVKEGDDPLGISHDNVITLPINFAQQLIDVESDRYDSQIVVKGHEGISEAAVESELEGAMRSIRRIQPNQEDNFAINKSTMISDQFDQVFKVLHTVGFIIGLFSILVGGFGIANIMFVSVKERTNIIGIQKSLGAKNYFILFQFLFEAISLCVMGGVLGIILVYAGTFAVKSAWDLQINLYLKNIIFGVSASVSIGIIAGIVPAWFAARLDPVEAIRTN